MRKDYTWTNKDYENLHKSLLCNDKKTLERYESKKRIDKTYRKCMKYMGVKNGS